MNDGGIDYNQEINLKDNLNLDPPHLKINNYSTTLLQLFDRLGVLTLLSLNYLKNSNYSTILRLIMLFSLPNSDL